jgi:hypothetical protein
VSASPTLEKFSRAELMQLCTWNDPNGCYSDEENMNEFGEVATDEALRAIVQSWVDAGDISDEWLAGRLARARAVRS